MDMEALMNNLSMDWRETDRAAAREAFQILHRTEKQTVLRNIVQILDEAALEYLDGRYDVRNAESCRWAYQCVLAFGNFPNGFLRQWQLEAGHLSEVADSADRESTK